MKTETLISCPSCAHEFHPGEALEQTIRARLEQQFKQASERAAAKARQEESALWKVKLEQSHAQVQALAQEKSALQEQAESLRVEQAGLQEKARELAAKEAELETIVAQKLQVSQEEVERKTRERLDAEYKRKEQQLAEHNRNIETQYLQRINEEVERVQHANDLKVRELTKRLEDQGSLLEEMKRKHEQGSMQLQGEVQELMIEDALRLAFPEDDIQPVPKGYTGADSIQVVMNHNRQVCGKIIYESKRTKHFSDEWLEKLKADARATQCEVAVLVTDAMPRNMTRFGFVDGVWVCTFMEFKSVAMILRQGMIKAGDMIAAQDNKGTKMQLLYDYLVGPQFKGSVEAIVEAFMSMKEGIEKEKRVQQKMWAEREKQLEKVMLGTTSMYGSIKGISGAAMEIKSLEHDESLLIED